MATTTTTTTMTPDTHQGWIIVRDGMYSVADKYRHFIRSTQHRSETQKQKDTHTERDRQTRQERQTDRQTKTEGPIQKSLPRHFVPRRFCWDPRRGAACRYRMKPGWFRCAETIEPGRFWSIKRRVRKLMRNDQSESSVIKKMFSLCGNHWTWKISSSYDSIE